MNEIPVKKIRRIEVDEDSGEPIVRVFLEVPKFQNFGQRLGELERAAWEADQAAPLDPAGLTAVTEGLLAIASDKEKTDRVQKRIDSLDAVLGGKMKSIMAEVNQQLLDLKRDLEREAAKKAAGKKVTREKPPKFEYHLQRLRVELPEGMKWNKTAEAAVDRFLARWPEIRPAVLEGVFKFYKKIYPQAVRPFRNNPGTKFTLPEPTSADAVADLFHVSVIYLHPDDAIGLGGGCTWDPEHLWGALLRKNKVVQVGGMDVAFN